MVWVFVFAGGEVDADGDALDGVVADGVYSDFDRLLGGHMRSWVCLKLTVTQRSFTPSPALRETLH